MNKRYIDFVPPKTAKPVGNTTGRSATRTVSGVAGRSAAGGAISANRRPAAGAKSVNRGAAGVAAKRSAHSVRAAGAVSSAGAVKSAKPARSAKSVKLVESAEQLMVSSGSGVPMLGVVEELDSRFINTNVPKRPLGDATHSQESLVADDLKSAKAKPVKNRRISRSAAKPVEKPVEKSSNVKADSAYKMPKSPFINQEKVVKRPLSKNVYQKKIEALEEKPKGPVTIIAKPEKDKHVGIIVTIVITIILGAAAGTVAFLLLPK